MINKKVLVSSLSILTTLAMMGSATYAAFSSTAMSANNTFSTGTVNLTVDDNNEAAAATVNASINAADLVPGGNAVSAGFISVHNGGSLPMSTVTFEGTETTVSSPDLAPVLNLTVKTGDNNTCTTGGADISGTLTTTLGDHVSPLTIAEINNSPASVFSNFASNATKYVCVSVALQDVGNSYQGKNIAETFTFVGNQ